MQYWSAYTGHDLILGYDRIIYSIVSETFTQHIKEEAKAYAARISLKPGFSKENIIAALMAPLTMKELRNAFTQANAFQSASEVMALFRKGDPTHMAANILNGQITSSLYLHNMASILSEIGKALYNGALYNFPHDTSRLHHFNIIATLPEALAYFLKKQKAEKQAFVAYLRHGIPPVITEEITHAIIVGKAVSATWGENGHALSSY